MKSLISLRFLYLLVFFNMQSKNFSVSSNRSSNFYNSTNLHFDGLKNIDLNLDPSTRLLNLRVFLAASHLVYGACGCEAQPMGLKRLTQSANEIKVARSTFAFLTMDSKNAVSFFVVKLSRALVL